LLLERHQANNNKNCQEAQYLFGID